MSKLKISRFESLRDNRQTRLLDGCKGAVSSFFGISAGSKTIVATKEIRHAREITYAKQLPLFALNKWPLWITSIPRSDFWQPVNFPRWILKFGKSEFVGSLRFRKVDFETRGKWICGWIQMWIFENITPWISVFFELNFWTCFSLENTGKMMC